MRRIQIVFIAFTLSVPTLQLELSLKPGVEEVDTLAPESAILEILAKRPRYNISVHLDYAEHSVEVAETIEYPNISSDTINALVLVVEPERLTENFEFSQLTWGNVDGEQIEDYQIGDGLLQIPLNIPLAPGEKVTLFLAYTFTLPERAGPFGYTERQAVFTNWYPFVPPYKDGEGWMVNPPGGVGEHLVYQTADFTVEFSLNDDRLILAGPAVPEVSDGSYIYVLEAARGFAWAVSPVYEILTSEINGIPVFAYVFPEHRLAGQAALDTAVQSLVLFQSLFGPYPYRSLSVVEINFADGLEADGLFFLGNPFFEQYDGTPQNFINILIPHETSHQWWYGLVGSDQAAEPWLDEALATYCELLFFEYNYPEQVDWWWEFRVDRHALLWEMDGSIYDYYDFSIYINSVYLKGAKFLHILRQEMGLEKFIEALRTYAERGQYRLMTGEDFFAVVAEYSPVDINPLIEEYFPNR